MNWSTVDDIFIACIIALIMIGIFSCVLPKEVITKPTICDYKVAIIYVKQFTTEEAFHISVKEQLKWLDKHGYNVFKICYEYGYDMTHKEILRFVVISYRPKEKQ